MLKRGFFFLLPLSTMHSQVEVSSKDKEAMLMRSLTPEREVNGCQRSREGNEMESRGRGGNRRNGRRGKGEWTNVGRRKQKYTISDKKKQQNASLNVLDVA